MIFFSSISYGGENILFVETDPGIDMDDSWVLNLLSKQDKFKEIYIVPNMAATEDQANQFQLIDDLISEIRLSNSEIKFEILRSIEDEVCHYAHPQYIKTSSSFSKNQKKRFDNRVDLKTKIIELNLHTSGHEFSYLSIAPPINLAYLTENLKGIEKNLHLVAMLGQLPETSRPEHNAKTSPKATNLILKNSYKSSHLIPINTAKVFHMNGSLYQELLRIPSFSSGSLMKQYLNWYQRFPYLKSFYADLNPYESSSCLFDVVALYFLLNPDSDIFHWLNTRFSANELGLIKEDSKYPPHYWHTAWNLEEEEVVSILSEWVFSSFFSQQYRD